MEGKPRKKSFGGGKRSKGGRRSNEITFEEISKFFHLKAEDAADKLGIGQTVLKKICRRHGISRWPFRRVAAVSRLFANFQGNLKTGGYEGTSAQESAPTDQHPAKSVDRSVCSSQQPQQMPLPPRQQQQSAEGHSGREEQFGGMGPEVQLAGQVFKQEESEHYPMSAQQQARLDQEQHPRLAPTAFLPMQDQYHQRVKIPPANFNPASNLAPDGEASPHSHQSGHLNNMNPIKLRQLLQKEQSMGQPLPSDMRLRGTREMDGHEQLPPMPEHLPYRKLTHDVEHMGERLSNQQADLALDKSMERMIERHMEVQAHGGVGMPDQAYEQHTFGSGISRGLAAPISRRDAFYKINQFAMELGYVPIIDNLFAVDESDTAQHEHAPCNMYQPRSPRPHPNYYQPKYCTLQRQPSPAAYSEQTQGPPGWQSRQQQSGPAYVEGCVQQVYGQQRGSCESSAGCRHDWDFPQEFWGHV